MAVTLRDVATLAGVSFKTVSNVLNGYPYIRADTRSRVLAAIEELGYTPNHAARTLRAGRTGTISLAVPGLGQSYWGEMASSVSAAAALFGRRVLVEQTNASRERELEILAGASRHITDGLVFNPLSLVADDLATLRGSSPLVLLGESLFPEAVDHITMQNVAAATAATGHLIAAGRRRIAFIGAPASGRPGIGTSALRMRGYREALEGAGLQEDPERILPSGGFGRADGMRAVQQLLSAEVPFDAIFAITDDLALGALHELRISGLRVPDDVAVIGFDDIEDGLYSAPALTTVDAGRRRIAELAVEVLERRIADASAPVAFIEVDFSIVRRESA